MTARIRFLGYRSDVPDVLRAADIFVLAWHREGMPRSIIEAMMTVFNDSMTTWLTPTMSECLADGSKTFIIDCHGEQPAMAPASTTSALTWSSASSVTLTIGGKA